VDQKDMARELRLIAARCPREPCFCGNAGFISGTIETIEAKQDYMQGEPHEAQPSTSTMDTDPAATALPSPPETFDSSIKKLPK
jgi:hypothetical protein